MKFCSKCGTKLTHNPEDVSLWICPKCNPEKIIPKRPVYGMNYSGRTKPCSKGCGAEIYWDEAFKSDSGKFIPIDARTDEPHTCEVGEAEPYYPDEIKRIKKESKPPAPKIPIPQNILFDTRKIPQSLVEQDPIIHEVIQGHKEKSHAIIHYENMTSPESEKIPVDNLKDMLSDGIIKGVVKYGFSGLLPFQAESIQSIIRGENTIISAPTGSGKTEAFTIPILEKISAQSEPGVFALFVYPLNALIDDQVSKVTDLIHKCKLDDKVGAYSIHGGQSTEYKNMIISEASKKSLIIATNFDFINYHLILQDKKWNELFKNAKIIVMDEAHSYTSFHGSNVYHVLKRMKRYMGKVQYIGSSATLDNSKEFFSNMFDLPKESFSYIKSKFRRKQNMHMFFIMPQKFGQRTTMEILSSICHRYGTTQLVFSNSHNDAEFLASNLEESNEGMRIQVHRGGLDQNYRKLYENQMKAGELDVLSCTPTLELGIDIGHVDVVISAFKNEYDSFVQRIGRAGRMGQKSYAICVFDPDDASCHYFARHIDQYLAQEHIIPINKKNPIIADKHLESIEIEKEAAEESDKSQYFDFANSINLRGASGEISIYHNSRKIGTRGVPVGYYQLHQNAIYHFNKQNYVVKNLIKSQNGARAYLERTFEKGKRTMSIVKTSIIQTSERNAVNKDITVNNRTISLRYGIIELNRTITGYLKGNYNESVDTFQTFNRSNVSSWRNFNWKSKHSAVKIKIPDEYISDPKDDSKKAMSQNSRIHTITHILVNAGKILTKSESNDIDAYYENGVIYLYDNSSDGFNGCSKIIFDNFEKVLQMSYSLLADCDCPTDKKIIQKGEDWGGCPKCTFTTNYCQTKNKDLSKTSAMRFFADFQHT
ncbi:DEAD/DEAH box helicase [Nitrosopumilus sp. K4]|uniref:DEAD/DEAH box helicase n=1 Tax=Nitrosopumilus sp. K4 TaxID=2795383 RepID=UPI001BA5691F|nr:DEAD/DEAH box helicase [Nitrosopumilus sp. K4]QUC65532.1 DEAD/DEAH box helicase [Nitrosopumilus sp. K4]